MNNDKKMRQLWDEAGEKKHRRLTCVVCGAGATLIKCHGCFKFFCTKHISIKVKVCNSCEPKLSYHSKPP